MGVMILSTPSGVITHEDAKSQNTGGRVLAYIY
jgi:ribosomal protein S8